MVMCMLYKGTLCFMVVVWTFLQRYTFFWMVLQHCVGVCVAAIPRGEDAGCVTTHFCRVQIHLHVLCYKGV